MAKHSPEPWHVGGVGGCRPKLVYDASGRTILRSWGNGSDEENEANVELAAQAPKLREQVRILREALTTLRSMHLAGLTADDPTIAIHQGICDRALEASRAEVAALRRQVEEREIAESEQEPLVDAPVVAEEFADNGAHSQWKLVDSTTGALLWEEFGPRAPSADVVTVPREHLDEWITAMRCSEPYVACGYDNTQKRLDAIESMARALRSGEAGKGKA